MKLCILWHMHQPFYKNLVTGRYEMPWVRLHGAKDYYDMVAILDEFPGIKQTFNLVPSLLEQIEEYGRGEAVDDHLELSQKEAASLNDSKKNTILAEFFKSNYETMIAPNKRYAQLYNQKSAGISNFTDQDWLDLQVWSNLAWIDPIFYNDKEIKYLRNKQKDFTENDKSKLLKFQQQVLGKIIPKYKEVAERGQIELSASPYFHPILPLLCDTDVARQSVPQISLPDNRFAHPEDAITHIHMAVDYFKSRFGDAPKGMWPSEGSVSEQIIPLLADAGIEWIATDEEILAMSLGRGIRGRGDDSLINSGELYSPYKVKVQGKQVHIFFRDHAISDLIGFVYSRIDPVEAAEDFIAKLEAIDNNLKRMNRPEGTVCVALDGENAWEYFQNDGHTFLKNLYQKLSEHPSITTMTFSEAIITADQIGTLKKLHPGSWINHDFGIWIGHPEDNKAWDLLYDARFEISKQSKNRNSDISDESFELARKELLIAEGSDWCWWFGDEHSSPDNDRFDQLYRSHLINVYKLLSLDVPAVLHKPIRTDYIRAHLIEPIDFIKPQLDGRITHFYEWANSGFFDCRKAGSTMHKADRRLKAIYYGYGKRGEVYIRVDPSIETNIKTAALKFQFTKPKGFEIVFRNGLASPNRKVDFLDYYIDRILEMGFKLKGIGGETSSVTIRVFDGDNEVERWPTVDTIPIRPDLAESQFWMV